MFLPSAGAWPRARDQLELDEAARIDGASLTVFGSAAPIFYVLCRYMPVGLSTGGVMG
ncbi:MAG TPA: hypothetical protein VHW90_00145 [Stellaceae bacterium]|jgi:hypothetical protein|nr:hypothetical protein [Stellaceae bacterium]